jgi:hypothetical protein
MKGVANRQKKIVVPKRVPVQPPAKVVPKKRKRN